MIVDTDLNLILIYMRSCIVYVIYVLGHSKINKNFEIIGVFMGKLSVFCVFIHFCFQVLYMIGDVVDKSNKLWTF